jgi:hypothetical protein
MPRPTKLNPDTHKAIVDALAIGATRKDAAHAAGVDYQTFLNWMKQGEEAKRGAFFEFFGEVTKAEADVRLKFTATFAKAAQGGDWRAAERYLRMRDPENWIERQEITGKDGGGITLKVVYGPDD